MPRIDLSPSDIETFLAVAETGSFSRAGTLLGLSQPAVSARISSLEQSLGVPLLHRTTRRVMVTDFGERLRTRLEQTIVDLRGLMQELRDEANLRRGRITVGASPSVAAGFLAVAISRFHLAHPDIEIVLLDDFYGRALDRVLRGEVDFAVIPFEPDSDIFDFELLLTDRFLVAVSAQHAFAGRRSVALADLVAEPLITMPPQASAWTTYKRAFETAGLAFNPALYTRNILTTLALVRAGFGVAFVPELLASTVSPMPGMVLLEVEGNQLDRRVGIIRPRDRTLSPAANAFRRALRTEALAFGSDHLGPSVTARSADQRPDLVRPVRQRASARRNS